MKIVLLKIVQFALLLLIMSLIGATVKTKGRTLGHEKFLWYGWPIRGLMLCCLGVLAFMIWDVMSGHPKATVSDWRVPAFYAAALLPTLIEIFGRRVLFSESEITIVSPWTGTRRIRLAEIIGIKYSTWFQWHRLQVSEKRSVFLSDLLSGKAELLKKIRATTESSADTRRGCGRS